MCKIFLISTVVLVLALIFGRRGAPKPPAVWGEGDRWQRFFNIYDSFTAEMFRYATFLFRLIVQTTRSPMLRFRKRSVIARAA
jgi:hypothetical protein